MTQTTNTQNCYTNFINYIMFTTGLPIDQMVTFEMWIDARKEDYKEVSAPLTVHGFEGWLNSIYGNAMA